MIDRTEIIELAKQHGAIDSYPGSNDGIVEFAPDQLESFFHAAQRLALEGVGIIATVGATYPELMEYVQSELEAIRNRGTT